MYQTKRQKNTKLQKMKCSKLHW